MSKKVILLATGLFAWVCLGSAAARADNWLFKSSICEIPMNGPQVFAYTSQNGIWSVWSANGGASWAIQNIVPDLSSLRTTQLGCAGDGSSQGLLLYRDGENAGSAGLWSRDRLSGWSRTLVPNSSGNVPGKGLTVTMVSDAGRNKFVVFATAGTNISMWVWDDAVNTRWGHFVGLPVELSPPGGINASLPNELASYSFTIGNPVTVGIVSVFVVANNGHLMENTGPLVGARTWVDHGIPPGTSGLSQSLGMGPTAVAGRSSPFGHPGGFTASDYNLRIIVPSADGSGIYASVQDGGAASFSWMPIAGNTTTPSFGTYASAGLAAGCFGVGEPCAPSVETGVTFLNQGVISFANYYWGTTDGSPSMAGWTVQTAPSSTPVGPVAYGGASWSKRGLLFYVNNTPDTMNVINLDTGAVTVTGHP